MLDGHVHIQKNVDAWDLNRKLQSIGFKGALLISPAPSSFIFSPEICDWRNRLQIVLDCCQSNQNLYPFLWIDPTETDAILQVRETSDRVAGYKIICNHFYPSDPKAMSVYAEIARVNKPVLFHSGTLWDATDSSKFNRPVEFECLLNIQNIRFALAHVSWPWCDECISLFGKIQSARASCNEITTQMYIDVTPGTPPIYRKEVLTKIFTVGYDVADKVFFGSDCTADHYGESYTSDWVLKDSKIYDELELSDQLRQAIFEKNLLQFING